MAKKQKLNEIDDEVIVKKIDLDEIDDEEEEEKEVTVMDMLNRIVVCLIIIAVILAINTVVLITKDGGSTTEEAEPTTTENSSSTSNYDVSMMNEVDVSGALDLFGDKGTYVLYVGRSDCSACIGYLPNLQEAQKNLGYTTQYLDLNKVSTGSSDYNEFLKKLNIDYTMTISGEEQTKSFSDWFGYTPMTIIIKNGKMVDGEIGSLTYDGLIALLQENGIE